MHRSQESTIVNRTRSRISGETWPQLLGRDDVLLVDGRFSLVNDTLTPADATVADLLFVSDALDRAGIDYLLLRGDGDRPVLAVDRRERRRLADVEARERELARGHPEFRHAGLVTVTARDLAELEDACAQIENAAGKSLIDLRPLVARQAQGWVASLPLGRSFKPGRT